MSEFYQVGGWQSHFRNWNEFKVSGGGYFQDDISGRISLLQGILPSGAAYILAPRSKEFQPYKRKPPYRSSDYASLSPIQFLTPKDLEATLKPLNEFKKWSEKEDTSAANKRYNQTHNGSGGRVAKPFVITGRFLIKKSASLEEETLRRQLHAGHQRSAFEHSRVLFQLIHGGLENVRLYSVGRRPQPIELCPKIVFYHATRTPVLERGRVAHRDSDALIFRDYGWGVLDTKSFTIERWTSLPVEGVLSNDDPQEAFQGKLVEDQPIEDVTRSVQSFIASILNESDSFLAPDTVIITCDAREQLRSLKECKVDVDNWEIGLCSLFDADAPVFGEGQNCRRDNSRSRSPGSSRKASRDPGKSPRRGRPSDIGTSRRTLSPHRQSDVRQRHRCSVHVIDVLDLWEVLPVPLFECDGLSELRKLALKLNINCNVHSWSAGNDIELLYKIWTSLCGGAPVDPRGAEIQHLIEIQNAGKLLSKGEPSTLEEQKPMEEDAADPNEDDDVEKSGKSMLNYAFGAGAVRDAAPKPKTPDYDPYADFADGFDRYDDSD